MRNILLAALLIIYSVAYSQNCNSSLSGKIIDLHDGSILSGATIMVLENNFTTISDIEGNYTILNLCDGVTYSIEILHPSCDTVTFKWKASYGKIEKDFKLEHHIEELNEIIVKGNSYKDQSKSVLESQISNKTLEKYSSASIGDALKSLSGVSSLNKGNGIVKPIIQGLHSSRIIMINNGVRMQDQEWGKEHAPNIDVNSTEKITS